MALFSSAWICCIVAVTLIVEAVGRAIYDRLLAALLTVLVVAGLETYTEDSGADVISLMVGVLLIFPMAPLGLPTTIPPEAFVVFPELLAFAAALIFVPANSN